MTTFAATVSELIEILQCYPSDWPVMIPNPKKNNHCSSLHGIYIYEGEVNQVKDYYHAFYERGHVPEGKTTIPALLLGDYWEEL